MSILPPTSPAWTPLAQGVVHRGARWSVRRWPTTPFAPGRWYVSNSCLDRIDAYAQAFANADDARSFAFKLAYGVSPYCKCGEPFTAFTRSGSAIHNGCRGVA